MMIKVLLVGVSGRYLPLYMGVSKNRGIPKSSILIRFSIINHPFWDTPIFGNTHVLLFLLTVRGEAADASNFLVDTQWRHG